MIFEDFNKGIDIPVIEPTGVLVKEEGKKIVRIIPGDVKRNVIAKEISKIIGIGVDSLILLAVHKVAIQLNTDILIHLNTCETKCTEERDVPTSLFYCTMTQKA